jgi:hypothetical protein
LAGLGRKRRKGKGRDRADSAACGGGRRGREEEERKGRLEADRWGPPVGAAAKEKEKGRREVGRLGCLGRKGKGASFLFFFFFFFKPHFQNHFEFKSISNFCKLFSNIL